MTSPLAAYTAWALDNGVRVGADVVVAELPEPYARGVLAREDVPANKPVISVPRRLLLSLYTLNDVTHPLAPVLGYSEALELREDDILAITLCYEKFVKVH